MLFRSKSGLNYSKTLHRRLTLRFIDINSYKTCEGDLICFPGFTSTSTKDIAGVFPTIRAKKMHLYQSESSEKKIKGSELQEVHMIIQYKHRHPQFQCETSVHLFFVLKVLYLISVAVIIRAVLAQRCQSVCFNDGLPNSAAHCVIITELVMWGGAH